MDYARITVSSDIFREIVEVCHDETLGLGDSHSILDMTRTAHRHLKLHIQLNHTAIPARVDAS
jgi:hypothetical protein